MSHVTTDEFATKHAVAKTALESIGLHKPDEVACRTADQFAKLMHCIARRFVTQYTYSLLTNIPCGVETRESVPEAAVINAVVSGLGEYIGWDAGRAIDLAHRILEESNVHDVAKLLADSMSM